MIPSETRDLMFAGAGILWGTVTVYRGMMSWQFARKKSAFPFVVVFGAVLAASCIGYLVAHSWAADTKTAAVYLQELQTKLDHTARRANQPTSSGSSVAGLRGSKQEPLSKQLYWKGKTEPAAVSIEEVKLFRTAVEQARAGNMSEAATMLQSFNEKYPQSALAPDVAETLKILTQ